MSFKFVRDSGNSYNVFEGDKKIGMFTALVTYPIDETFTLYTDLDMENEFDAGAGEGRREALAGEI